MVEIGNTLREARTRQGLSIHDAEEATKIRTRYLQALEQEDFEVIPGSTFVMGFLRTYALYLQLDADALVEEYLSQHDPQFMDCHRLPTIRMRSRSSRSPSSRSSYVVVAILALIIILVLAWIGWGNRGKVPATMETPSTTTAGLVSAGTLSTTPFSTGTRASATVTESTAQSVETQGEGEHSGDTQSEGAPVVVEGRQAQEASELIVQVKAQDDRCYLMVREDSEGGRTLYSQTLDENEEVTFTATNALWMNIANPSAIALVINGMRYQAPEPYGVFKVTAAGLERL